MAEFFRIFATFIILLFYIIKYSTLYTMGVLKSTAVRAINFERNSEIAPNGVHPAESAEDPRDTK